MLSPFCGRWIIKPVVSWAQRYLTRGRKCVCVRVCVPIKALGTAGRKQSTSFFILCFSALLLTTFFSFSGPLSASTGDEILPLWASIPRTVHLRFFPIVGGDGGGQSSKICISIISNHLACSNRWVSASFFFFVLLGFHQTSPTYIGSPGYAREYCFHLFFPKGSLVPAAIGAGRCLPHYVFITRQHRNSAGMKSTA